MKLLIIGDACKDIFNYGLSTRLAPEAPVPVFNTIASVENFGMAGNVYKNVESLIKKNKLSMTCNLISNPNWEEIKKIRFVDDVSNHMFLRVDENDKKFERVSIKDINFSEYDMVIISDYNKGFLHEEDIQFILHKHPLTVIDTKKKFGSWIDKATFIKVNSLEYNQNKDYIDTYLLDKTIITLGKRGCSFKGKIWEVPEVQVKDVAGAGDSFLAGFCVYYLINKNPEVAIVYGNDCSTTVVQKKGVCVV